MAKSFVLKLANYCECDGCNKTMKKLREIDGVDSAPIDPKTGKLTVSGPVDPQKVIRFLEERGKEAELVTEENRPAASMRQRVVVQELEPMCGVNEISKKSEKAAIGSLGMTLKPHE
ncbi:hypothetical protein RHSIM_Rhsim13G0022900 [Rhododendron simsii]|uniref:HMA domain-containing protein n=1 Tax=Rhododendron simsii TaxID=118357 RepID=A0A834FXG1_RHOSS|nr:hypothetical protein RHSIM_Rhsim13G0022900 [Rhododendron simsii]